MIELECLNGTIGQLKISQGHDDWSNLRVLQLFMADLPVDPPVNAPSSTGLEVRDGLSHEGLSTIPEESEQDLSDNQSDQVSDYLHHADPELQRILESIPDLDYMIAAPGEAVAPDELGDRLPLSLLSAPADELILVPPIELNQDTS